MSTKTPNPVICAIDTTDIARASALAEAVKPSVGAIKLGLEFFTHNGAAGVKKVIENGAPLFLDLKFHDIPNTVAGAIRATAGINCFMMTIHAGGGATMMRAARDAAEDIAAKNGKRPLIIGVTILTSMDERDMHEVGVSGNVADQVKKLADLAQASGLDGVVCSPFEIAMLKAQCGKDFKLIVPGIRPAGSDNGDQKRVLTPAEAVAQGADYLVIGRPITGAASPADAAADILKTL